MCFGRARFVTAKGRLFPDGLRVALVGGALSGGAIAGIVVAVLLLVAIAVGFAMRGEDDTGGGIPTTAAMGAATKRRNDQILTNGVYDEQPAVRQPHNGANSMA